MKIFIILLSFCVIVCSAVYVPEYGDLENEPAELSEKGKLILRNGALRLLAELCLGDDADESILNTVCRRASATKVGKKSVSDIQTRECMSCQLADPVCFAACPE